MSENPADYSIENEFRKLGSASDLGQALANLGIVASGECASLVSVGGWVRDSADTYQNVVRIIRDPSDEVMVSLRACVAFSLTAPNVQAIAERWVANRGRLQQIGLPFARLYKYQDAVFLEEFVGQTVSSALDTADDTSRRDIFCQTLRIAELLKLSGNQPAHLWHDLGVISSRVVLCRYGSEIVHTSDVVSQKRWIASFIDQFQTKLQQLRLPDASEFGDRLTALSI
jgi:hypothetical protein